MKTKVWAEHPRELAVSLTYDFERRAGTLKLLPCSCTDMTAAIALFTGIDPSVVLIETWAGKTIDTTYRRSTGWVARCP